MIYFVEIIKAVVWPITLFILAMSFRSELRRLAERVSQLKYKDLEAKFEKQLAEAEVIAAKIDIPHETSPLSNPAAANPNGLRRIAEISPRAAIVEAWNMIEAAAIQRGLGKGSAIVRVSQKELVDLLTQSGRLSHESLRLVEDLRRLRNQAAHAREIEVSSDDAERYLDLAAKCVAIINNYAYAA